MGEKVGRGWWVVGREGSRRDWDNQVWGEGRNGKRGRCVGSGGRGRQVKVGSIIHTVGMGTAGRIRQGLSTPNPPTRGKWGRNRI